MSANANIKVNVSDQALEALIQDLRKLGAEAGKSQKDIDAMERSLRKTSDSAGKAGNQVKSSWGGMDQVFAKAGAAFVAAFAVERIMAVTTALYGNAANLEQLGVKASTVFGTYRLEVEATAKKVAEAMGMSEAQFVASAAAAADLLIPMGFNRKMATGLSTDLVKLSGALAQWSGGKYDAVQTSEILTKALLGERDQLKSLGIAISEADVSAKLLEKGQKNLTGAALEQAKAMATLELIYAKSTDAQDAFAKGGDNIVSQSAKAKAAFQDIVDILTELLTPAFATVTSAIATALKEFKHFVEVVTSDPKDSFIKEFVAQGVEEFNKLDLEGQAARINELATVIQEGRDNVKKLGRDLLIAGSDTEGAVDIGFIRRLQKEYEILQARLEGQEALQKVLQERYKETTKEIEDQGAATANVIITIASLKDKLKELEERKATKISIFDLQGLAQVNKQIGRLKEEIKFLEDFENPDRRPMPIIERMGFIGNWEETLEGKLNRLKKFIQDVDNLTKESYMRGELSQDEFENRRLEIRIQALRKEKELLEAAGEDTLDVHTKLLDAELALFDKKEREKTAKLKEQEAERRKVEEAAIQYGQDIVNTYFDLRLTQMDAEMAQLEQMKQHELALAGNNAEAKAQIEERYAAKQAAARRKQAQAQQNAALFGIGVKTAENLVEAFPNPYLMAAAGLLGLLQAAVVRSQPVPGFKDGVYNLHGPGTTTSDSIPANLSRGESVVQAKPTSMFGWLIKPMIEDKGFSNAKLRALVDEHLPTELKATPYSYGSLGIDYDQLAGKVAGPIVSAIKNKDTLQMSFDKRGFNASLSQRSGTVNLLNNRNRFFGQG